MCSVCNITVTMKLNSIKAEYNVLTIIQWQGKKKSVRFSRKVGYALPHFLHVSSPAFSVFTPLSASLLQHLH